MKNKLKNVITYLVCIVAAQYLNGQIARFNETSVLDANKNAYETTQIGNISWSTSNLRATKFRNGESIYQAKNSKEWDKAITENKPAWCYFKWDKNTQDTMGLIYNVFAIRDPRGLVPEGCEIPDAKDWAQLLVPNQGKSPEESPYVTLNGRQLNTIGTSKGFNAFPNGGLSVFGPDDIVTEKQFRFESFRKANFWTSTHIGKENTFIYTLEDNQGKLRLWPSIFGVGYPIRFIRKQKHANATQLNVLFTKGEGVVDIDNNVYETIKINDDEWMAKNLNVSRFNDGTPIPLAQRVDDLGFNDKQMKPVVTSAYYGFNNNYKDLGRFYSLMVVENSKNVCPTGWHVATKDNWSDLENWVLAYFTDNGNLGIPPAIFKTDKKDPRIKGLINYTDGLNFVGLDLVPAGQFGGANLWDYSRNITEKWSFKDFNSFGAAGVWWRMGINAKDYSKTGYTTRMHEDQRNDGFFYTNPKYLTKGNFAQIRCVKDPYQAPKQAEVKESNLDQGTKKKSLPKKNNSNSNKDEIIDVLQKAKGIFKR
jgi:uncharacterized protein (TIGR02145 family)